jgi:hypothetical protein
MKGTDSRNDANKCVDTRQRKRESESTRVTGAVTREAKAWKRVQSRVGWSALIKMMGTEKLPEEAEAPAAATH